MLVQRPSNDTKERAITTCYKDGNEKHEAPILCAKDRGFEGYELSLRERVAYSALMRTIRFQTFSP